MRMHFAALTSCVLLSLGLAGCNVDTGDSWDRPLVLASDLTPTAMVGRWEGSWQSYEFWDSGLIHFVITPADAAPPPATLPAAASLPEPGTQRYLAHVTLWHWGRICPEEFNMVLISTRGENGQIQFHGERNLGPLNGSCKFDGFIEANRSAMTYVNREDFGTVTVRRVIDAGALAVNR